MKSDVVSSRQKRADRELYAARSYCAWPSGAKPATTPASPPSSFHRQSAEERTHAQKFFRRFLDRGAGPVIGAVPTPRGECVDFIAVDD